MKSGRFEGKLVEGEIVMDYDLSEGEVVELKIPVGSLAKPVLAGLKEKIMSGEIDLVKGVDFDKELALKAIAALELAIG